MSVRVIEPRLVKTFKIVFKLFPPDLTTFNDDGNGGNTMYECYVDVKHLKDSIYVVEVECDDPVETHYIETDKQDNINLNFIKKLAEDICYDWDDCEEIVEIREI